VTPAVSGSDPETFEGVGVGGAVSIRPVNGLIGFEENVSVMEKELELLSLVLVFMGISISSILLKRDFWRALVRISVSRA
jgi:hypothetical protein